MKKHAGRGSRDRCSWPARVAKLAASLSEIDGVVSVRTGDANLTLDV